MRPITERLYYYAKPFIPRWLQIQLRRAHVCCLQKINKRVWPIDPNSAVPPQNWRGWPGGKRFAFVITHDVESADGLAKCRRLMELDSDEGFYSSFNFVIKDYDAESALIALFKERGFEVGIHGLNHHRNPFRDEHHFRNQAIKINESLRKWNAVGFRCPSMYHDFRLLHCLDIEYDASTFDTDPFEPQPDGLGTIFPKWINGAEPNRGYVELPYTLPQDFLVFIILRSPDISIWKRKLDWIAEKGGMALFIAHPDYMNFDDKKAGLCSYSVERYREFLRYVKAQYQGQYWNALPAQVAIFWRREFNHPEFSRSSSKLDGFPLGAPASRRLG